MSSTHVHNVDAVVVGAGPAGLATAMERAPYGVSTLLVEGSAQHGEHDWHAAAASLGVRVLLLDPVAARAVGAVGGAAVVVTPDESPVAVLGPRPPEHDGSGRRSRRSR